MDGSNIKSLNKALYLKIAEYELLKTTTSYHKSDGPCLKALDKVLMAKNK